MNGSPSPPGLPSWPVCQGPAHRTPAAMLLSFIPRLPTLLPCVQLVFPLGTYVLLSPGKGFCTHFLAENGSFIAFSACFLHRNFRVGLQNSHRLKPLQASVEPCPTDRPPPLASVQFRLQLWTPDLSLEVSEIALVQGKEPLAESNNLGSLLWLF